MEQARAIILAAGIGTRLKPVSGGRPKCLLHFGGRSLLRRHISVLAELGIADIMIVTGYAHERVAAELAQQPDGVRVTTVFNPDFESGSVVSLLAASAFLRAGDTVILMDADVLYDPKIMARLVDSRHENCFLLDREFEQGDEPVKICVRDETMVEFRKQVDSRQQFDFQGESVGFFRFNGGVAAEIAARCGDCVNAGDQDAPYEEVLRSLLLDSPERFGYEDITGLPWIEIDFPEDVKRAENEILAKITRQNR